MLPSCQWQCYKHIALTQYQSIPHPSHQMALMAQTTSHTQTLWRVNPMRNATATRTTCSLSWLPCTDSRLLREAPTKRPTWSYTYMLQRRNCAALKLGSPRHMSNCLFVPVVLDIVIYHLAAGLAAGSDRSSPSPPHHQVGSWCLRCSERRRRSHCAAFATSNLHVLAAPPQI